MVFASCQREDLRAYPEEFWKEGGGGQESWGKVDHKHMSKNLPESI